MAVNPSALGPKPQIVDSAGEPYVGGRLFFYVAGSVGTKQDTYTDSTGVTANTNPVVLNSLGEPSTQIWWTSGLAYKVVLAPPGADDPPSSPVWTIDNLRGINDTSVGNSQWVDSGIAPTYVSATQFTMAGDQTGEFQVGRRCKFTVTAGTVYGTITVSAYTVLTTVTVVLDSGALDSGLSAVQYGILTPQNFSAPVYQSVGDIVTVSSAGTLGRIAVGATGFVLSSNGTSPVWASVAPRSYLAGCGLANGTDATNDINIAAGVCRDSTNAVTITVAAMAGKQLDAGWAPGANAGMRNSAAAITDTTYHIYAVSKADGTQDIYADTSVTVATVIAALQAESGGADYLYARRIGSIIRASGAILLFFQNGDLFQLNTRVQDVNATNPGTSAVTRTMTVPTGVVVQAWIQAILSNGGAGGNAYGYFTNLAIADTAASATIADIAQVAAASGSVAAAAANLYITTNTSAQVRSRLSFSDGSVVLTMNSLGWIDSRGRDA